MSTLMLESEVPSVIDNIISNLQIGESKDRLQSLNQLEQLLKTVNLKSLVNESNEQIAKLVDILGPTLEDNNFKIIYTVLSCIEILAEKLDHEFASYLQILILPIGEKLGDAKPAIRTKVLEVIQTSMTVLAPTEIFEKLEFAFQHRNYRVKEQILLCFIQTINHFGCRSLSFSSFLPKILKLMEDPNSTVRECAVKALEEIYRYVGDELKDVLRSKEIRPAQLNLIFEKFAAVDPVPPEERVSLYEAQNNQSKSSTAKRAVSGSKTSSLLDRLQNSNGNKIKPLKVQSDKELQKEIDKIVAVLSNADADWKVRTDALGKIQRLVYGGATELESFHSLFHKLKEPLEIQLSDLRSAVVKEACATLGLLSMALRDAFEPFMEFFITVLLKLVINSITVIADSGDSCIKTLLQNCKVDRVVPLIIKNSSTHKLLRARCIEYVLLMLSEQATSSLDKYTDIMEETIRSRLSDALPEVRATAKRCYFVFSQRWSDRATRLMHSLDASVQKHLNDERQKEERKFHSANIITFSNGVLKKSTTDENSDDIVSKPPPNRQAAKLASSGSINTNSMSGKSTTKEGSGKPMRIIEDRTQLEASANLGILSAPPMRVLKASTPVATSVTPKRIEGGPQRVPVKQDPVKELKLDQITSSARRVPLATQINTVAVATPTNSGTLNPKIPSSINKSAVDDKTVGQIVEMASSSLWSTRVDCFMEMRSLFASAERRAEVAILFEKVVCCCIDHLADPHHKVVQQCVDAILPLVSAFPEELEPYLERLLPQLFKKFSENKEAIKKASVQLTQHIIDTYHADVVTQLLLKILDQPNMKLKSICLEYLTNLVPQAAPFYQGSSHILDQLIFHLTGQHIRTAIHKVVVLLAEKNIMLKKGATIYLLELYRHYKQFLLAQIPMLAINLQLEVRKVLIPYVPDIDEELLASSDTTYQRTNGISKDASTLHEMEQEQNQEDSEELQQSTMNLREDSTSFAAPLIGTTVHGLQSAQRTELYTPSKKYSAVADNLTLDDVSTALIKLTVSSAPTRKEGLHKLIELSRENDEATWVAYFDKILGTCLSVSKQDEEDSLRELTVLLITDILKNQSPLLFRDIVDTLLASLLESTTDSAREVCQAAEEALEQLTQSADPVAVLQVLAAISNSKDGKYLPVMLTCIKMTGKAIGKLTAPVLLQHLDTLLPGLFEAFKSSSTDVRKAVVMCLVDIYFLLGEDLAPYLAQLTPTQAKLVQIYFNKRKNQR